MIKRLVKCSNFPTLEPEIQLDLSTIQRLIQSKDTRLLPKFANPYNNESNFAEVYVDNNSKDNEKFYTVEFLAYTDVPDTNNGKNVYNNYMGAVAT